MNPIPLRDRITAEFERLSPELQRAARWVNDHPVELVTQSMRRSAMAAGVAPATMTRLAQALGYRGFDDMRTPEVQQAVVLASNFASKAAHQQAAKALQGQSPSAWQDLVHDQVANITQGLDRNRVDTLEAVADALIGARQVLCLGLRAAHGIAMHLHYSCNLLLPNVGLAQSAAGTLRDQIWALQANDVLVVVGVSPYTRETVQLAQLAAAQGCAVVAITDSALGPLAQVARHTLLVKSSSPAFFHSLVGAQAMAEAITATVAARGGAAVMQRLTQLETRLNQEHLYWEKPAQRQLPPPQSPAS